MKRIESNTQESTEILSDSQIEKSKLVVSSREGNLIILSGKKRESESIRPINFKLSAEGVLRIRKLHEKNGKDAEKTAECLGVPVRWIHSVIQQYNLG
ncbi:hypothetical protein HZA44_03300 [Candidatus Peregrinibacteria bacterium]|nr:hypothetical protein [Candidatus Peregrinibacteria bacterium]